MLLKSIPMTDISCPSHLDFVTLEDDLPAEVSFTAVGAVEKTTSFTDVKTETTDEN